MNIEKVKTYLPLTFHQMHVLSWMGDKNVGAVLFEGRYRFPVHFRQDPGLAERYARKLSLEDSVHWEGGES